MSTTPAAGSEPIAWIVPGDAFVARRLREIVEPGDRAGAIARDGDAAACVVATSRGIARVDLAAADDAALPGGVRDEPGLADVAALVARCLRRWEPGAEALPIDARGTPFQVAAWTALRTVPPGRTITYAGLASLLGRGSGAARAVGQAMGANPVPVLVPCHRVVGAGGDLGGFACGTPMKRRLLAAEGVHA